MVQSARIVLVLRFHCTLATPRTYCGLLQSTTSTLAHKNTVLITHKIIEMIQNVYKIVQIDVCKNSFFSIYSSIIFTR